MRDQVDRVRSNTLFFALELNRKIEKDLFVKLNESQRQLINKICTRAHYLTTQMIYLANHRADKSKGDPKVGGHPAACASSLHITAALHLLAKTGFDYIANKPHAAPLDHSWNYLLQLFLNQDLHRLTNEEANLAMHGLRQFPSEGQPVFQSYHSAYDPDHHGFLPSGTVGIPPVNVGYLAHAYLFARDHGYNVPDAHFWAILGDSEFREGSVYEAVPDFAERELGNLTWIVDYNRQSLDGHRITNKEIMDGTDDSRIERMMRANGWDVIQVRHGRLRQKLFQLPDGEKFQKLLEVDLQDYELQALLLVKDAKALYEDIQRVHPHLKTFLKKASPEELFAALRDFGGHDVIQLAAAMEASKADKKKPTIIIAHTLKGWGLNCAAAPGNHSLLPDQEEIDELRKAQGLSEEDLFAGFDPASDEGEFLRQRGDQLLSEIQAMRQLKQDNETFFAQRIQELGEPPQEFAINLKMASYPHTQWMLGQCTAKLTRIANTPLEIEGHQKKPLAENERAWKTPAELLVSMAPDVGTSTNLNPAMDGKIFGSPIVPDWEADFGVKDKKTPDLVPGEDKSDRFIRFEIAEGNALSCLGSYGKMRDFTGIPLLPLMTVYDFFIKRAHDQFFYDLYWKSSFILVGTPSGVTLSPEGAQHGWKSDFQIPNQITWEPFFCLELDWILADSIRRHFSHDNVGRTGVLIRGVTRGIDQKLLMHHLKKQSRFKSDTQLALHPSEFPLAQSTDESNVAAIDDQQIEEILRQDVLAGAYYLVDYRGYAGYEPGDNVVHIFAMGSLCTEALEASERLLKKGIYANVIVVTSPDLVCGNLAHENNYQVLRERLGLHSHLILRPTSEISKGELMTLAGFRVPIVSVHDGEPGLLDNLGSIVGVRQESLAVRRHSRCGRPTDVYGYHEIDAEAVIAACLKTLNETAMANVQVSNKLWNQLK